VYRSCDSFVELAISDCFCPPVIITAGLVVDLTRFDPADSVIDAGTFSKVRTCRNPLSVSVCLGGPKDSSDNTEVPTVAGVGGAEGSIEARSWSVKVVVGSEFPPAFPSSTR